MLGDNWGADNPVIELPTVVVTGTHTEEPPYVAYALIALAVWYLLQGK
jgi:hypothetical protein